MNHKMRKVIAALFAVLVVSTGIAAAATFDTETIDTATQSDVSGATNTVVLDPGNATESLYVETDGASTGNLTLEITPAEKGLNTVVYKNETPVTVNSTAGHYAFDVGHDELADTPRDEIGGTYNVTVVNDTGGVEAQTEVTFETSKAGDDNAVMWVTDDSGTDAAAMSNLVADSVEITGEETGILYWSEEFNISTWSGYTAVNGTHSNVTIHFKNTSTSGAYGNTVDEDTENGDWITGQTVWVNGIPHKVYMNEAPEDVEKGETVVTYDNSTKTLNADLGKEYEGTRTVSIRATGGDGYAFGELWSNFGAWDALSSQIPV